MKRTALAVAVIMAATCLWAGSAWAQPAGAGGGPEPGVVRGKVDAVTVYRGQALVTRLVDVPGGTGLSEVVVSELPERVVPGSLFAETEAGGAEVRSVRYRVRPQMQDVREEVRKLDDEIRGLTDKVAANQKGQQTLADEKAYLEKLATFVAPTATTEMTKGVLNAETVQTLTKFQFTQRDEIAKQELKLAQEQRDLNETLGLKQRQRAEIAGRSSREIREAVVFLNVTKPGGKLRVRYMVDGATWMPSYNVRAGTGEGGQQATVEYQASIEQMSGEDWTDVQMTLSTAAPNLVANAPVLAPLSIALGARPAGPEPVLEDYHAVKGEIAQQQKEVFDRRNSKQGGNGPAGGSGGAMDESKKMDKWAADDLELNRLADTMQVLELVAKEKPTTEQELTRHAANEGIVVTYPLEGRTSLPSRSDRQLIQIAALPIKGTFYKMAVPVLTNYVYDEATLTNSSSRVLLAGPVASYRGGQFVGNGEIPTVAVGQTFQVGFGIDSSLRATRQRVDKTDTIQGGNKVLSYTYRLAIDNYGNAPAAVRVMDRLPTAKETEMKIGFVEAKGPDDKEVTVSGDKEYQQAQRKNGILRWDVTVPPEKAGSEAWGLTYKITMEYDKNLTIGGQEVLRLQDMEKNLRR